MYMLGVIHPNPRCRWPFARYDTLEHTFRIYAAYCLVLVDPCIKESLSSSVRPTDGMARNAVCHLIERQHDVGRRGKGLSPVQRRKVFLKIKITAPEEEIGGDIVPPKTHS